MLVSKTLRGFQFGLESTASQGTAVVANRILKNGTFSNKRQNNVKKGEAEGHKSAIGQQRGKRWSEWKLNGQLGYNIPPYVVGLLLSAAAGAAPTSVGTGAYQYGATMSSQNSDTPQTLTFEYGNNLGSNSRFAYGTAADLTIKVNESSCDYDISGFGAYPAKNVTLNTTGVVTIPALLANMTDFRFNYASTFAGLSSGKLLTAKDLEINVKNKYKAVFFIDDATVSIGGILERRPEITGKVIVAQGTESDYFLGNLETSTMCYMQMQGTGPLIGGGVYNSLKLTFPFFVNNEDETDDSDLFAGSYDFYAGEDTVNGDFSLSAVCALANL